MSWLHVVLFLFMVSGAAATLAAEDTSDWFEFRPADDAGPSVIGMRDWLDDSAGAHGAVRLVNDHFRFEDGTPVKFWGVNLGNMDCAPEKEHGARWAAWHAKYGVNCVRLHKFIEPGQQGIGDPQDSTKFEPQALDRLDYFVSQMKKNGIYYGFSWVFGHRARPADKDRLVAYDEIMAAGGGTSRVPVFIGEDIQKLRITMMVNLLNHRNPYTGLTYGEDPALAFIEFHNEDSIFFYTFGGYNDMSKMPTYKKAFNARFSAWLKQKYGSHQGLVAAWGEQAMDAFEIKGEHLDKANIMVQGNPWFASPEGLAQARETGTRQRLLDTAAFLHHAQGSFYRNFRDAIRDVGYDGPLVGSCWATPSGVPQYYNLHNDYEVGLIDRHAYFGKGTHGWRPQPGEFGNDSQLDRPGSGILSSGLLQVVDRPFAISEWTTVFPNEWVLESSAIFAAYGMGLQGWDASYHFASHTRSYGDGMFASRTCDPRLWVVDVPHQIGLYPVLARMIYRGDVQEGEIISTRRVSLGELAEGNPDWIQKETIKQSWDFKEYGGAVSSAALAAGRVVVEFGDAPAKSDIPDMDRYVKNGAIRSVTGELEWHGATDAQRGYFTIDTAGTKALVGFAPRRAVALGNVSFRTENPFAGIFLTSLGRDRNLADDKRLLLLAMARVRNTDMEIDGDKGVLTKVGKTPMIMEPVKASVTIDGRRIKSVRILDHDGRRTDRTLPVRSSTFGIDGARDRAFYYEIEVE
jgi:hypothetical protein